VKFDLIVVGAGPVATTLACSARSLAVALVGERPGSSGLVEPAVFDPRVYAISPANVAFLREIGVWQKLDSERLTPIHSMRVFGDRTGSEIVFDAYRAGVPELAWTVEDSRLRRSLLRCVEAADHVQEFAATGCRGLRIDGDAAVLQLNGDTEVAGALVAGADGARSFVRDSAGLGTRESEYGQIAVAANFECEKGHGNTAWQWFQGGPVLALLPLPGRRVSMIWSLPVDEAQAFMRLDGAAICRKVQEASRHFLGELALASDLRSYPLRRLSARRMVAPRIALAGDAAHVIHPLAGQGLNVGLQDVHCLAEILNSREPGRDPGDPRLLRRYARRRAEPILAMDLMVDGLFRLFGNRNESAFMLRNAGLNLAGRIPVLKNLLMRYAMS
jgi:2-polyprenylphenol 6-hydroxylase